MSVTSISYLELPFFLPQDVYAPSKAMTRQLLKELFHSDDLVSLTCHGNGKSGKGIHPQVLSAMFGESILNLLLIYKHAVGLKQMKSTKPKTVKAQIWTIFCEKL